MLSFAVLALVLLLFGATVLTAALMMSRRARLEMEQRVNLVAGVRETRETAETLGGLLKVRTKKFDVQRATYIHDRNQAYLGNANQLAHAPAGSRRIGRRGVDSDAPFLRSFIIALGRA